MSDKEALTKLRAFCQDLVAGDPGFHFGDIDGGTLQELALKHGLYEPYTATEPCCEGCGCVGWDDFPQTCNRQTWVLTGALPQLRVK